MVAEFGHKTRLVLAVNVALVNPAGTVTLDGTLVTAVLLLVSATTAPPAGAGPLSVTVPVEELPPIALDGFIASEVSTGASTVIVAVCVAPLNTANRTHFRERFLHRDMMDSLDLDYVRWPQPNDTPSRTLGPFPAHLNRVTL